MIVTPDTGGSAFLLIMKGWHPIGLAREVDLVALTFKRIIFHGPVFGKVVMVAGMLEDHGTFDRFTVVPGGPGGLVDRVKHLPGYVDYADPVAKAEAQKAASGPDPWWLIDARARGAELAQHLKGPY